MEGSGPVQCRKRNSRCEISSGEKAIQMLFVRRGLIDSAIEANDGINPGRSAIPPVLQRARPNWQTWNGVAETNLSAA